jgi:hypothetical protein
MSRRERVWVAVLILHPLGVLPFLLLVAPLLRFLMPFIAFLAVPAVLLGLFTLIPGLVNQGVVRALFLGSLYQKAGHSRLPARVCLGVAGVFELLTALGMVSLFLWLLILSAIRIAWGHPWLIAPAIAMVAWQATFLTREIARTLRSSRAHRQRSSAPST